MKIQYTIPTVLLSTTFTACADPIVGEWTGTKLTNSGEVVDLPYERCYEPYLGIDSETGEYMYGDEECTSLTYSMTINSDLTGTFKSTYLPGGTDIAVEKEESSRWTISLTVAGTDATLDCNLNDKELECAVEGSNGSLTFEK